MAKKPYGSIRIDGGGHALIEKAPNGWPLVERGQWTILEREEKLERVVTSCPYCATISTLAYLNNTKLMGYGHHIYNSGHVYPYIHCSGCKMEIELILEDWGREELKVDRREHYEAVIEDCESG